MIFQFLLGNNSTEAETISTSAWSGATIFIIAVVLVVLVFCIIIGRKIWRRLHEPELHGLDRKKIQSTWGEIQKTSDQGIMGAKIAVIEADKLLDGVLKSMFMPGETLGERLKVAAYKYPNIRQVWPAHRLRNQLVHDNAFQITMRQAKSAIHDYEHALKTLNVL